MDLQKGLVGHWTLDDRDTSGGTVYDRSALNNHGLINNSPNSLDTIVGDGLEFTDGNSEWIDGSSALDYSSGLSTVVWIKPNMSSVDISDSPSRRGIIDDDVFEIDQKVNQNISMRINSTSIGDVNNSTFEYTDGEWWLATMTFDGSTLKMYRNTEQLDSASSSISTPSSAPRIATNHNDNRRMWQGQIAEARVYDRALTEDEISALYNMRSQRLANI